MSVSNRETNNTHWPECWRAHHECAVALLDKILKDEAMGADETHRRLAEAKAWAAECDEFGCTDPDHSSRLEDDVHL